MGIHKRARPFPAVLGRRLLEAKVLLFIFSLHPEPETPVANLKLKQGIVYL